MRMAKIVSGLPVRLISSVMKKSSSNLKSGRSNRTKISTNIVLLFCLLARLSYADSASLKVDCRKYGTFLLFKNCLSLLKRKSSNLFPD